MKIAIASQDQQTITAHAGRCQNFWVYETSQETVLGKSLLALPKEQSFHNSSPHEAHPLDEVQVLIAGGMGSELARRLASKGIEGIVTRETNPDQAVSAYLEGSLTRESPETHDHGHQHRHQHQHEHQHGHQHQHQH